MPGGYGGGVVSVDGGPVVAGLGLRQARLAALLSIEELAEKSGVSVRAISNLERGRTRHPHPRTARLLMVALGIGTAGSDGELLPLSLDVGATAGHPKSAEAPVLVSPAQLPAGTRHFVGRAAELVALTDLLEEARAAGVAVTAVIGGTAGVGKTALAVHWARLSAGRFPGGQLYVNLRGFDPSGAPVAAADAIRGFLDALVPSGQIPTTAQAQAGLYRSLLAERSMLIVLDNARDAAQVRELLPGSASCMVVVTSRSQLTGLIAADGACPLQLGVLSHADAGELLARRLGRDRLAAEPQAGTSRRRQRGFELNAGAPPGTRTDRLLQQCRWS